MEVDRQTILFCGSTDRGRGLLCRKQKHVDTGMEGRLKLTEIGVKDDPSDM